MLCDLSISNFALIEKQTVSFGEGLNVISGETGAGKSMVLQALELILGGRPKGNQVRTGSEGWEIQALFALSGLPEKIRNELPDIAAGDELLVSRSMNLSGRGKVFINGQLGSVSLLEEICKKIINICGQGQHVRLLDARYHLELIDGFAGNESLLAKYEEAYDSWKAAAEQFSEIQKKAEGAAARRSELEGIVVELEGAAPRAGLRQELEDEVKRMANAEGILLSGRIINEGINAEGGALAGVQAILGEVLRLSKLDPGCGEVRELCEAAKTNLEECDRVLSQRLAAVEVSEEELESLRERLAEIARLERKFRTNDEGLVEVLEESRRELALLEDPLSLAELKKEVDQKFTVVTGLGEDLSKKRKQAALGLTSAAQQELAELNLKDARMEVEFCEGDFGPGGKDQVQFLVSTNKGEPLRPLKEVASGGELSRIMLVLKKVLREKSGVNVLVFDEVDAGVSGGVARAVGEKLKSLAQQSQVICITHLAQVASLADHHFLVQKESGKRTVASIRELDHKEKVEEVARMLSGHKVTEASRQSARELMGGK
ncbi:MAG: DNA repair protein RecN [Deltaproteobacteria bacterium]|nr:DNA repair protein RecN [Deltaproteobacteria bacterium]